ncbi:hypothetical protein ACFVU2_03720 [Leifsonia sp. NPDC058194]|uniref:hypothetical protein n=1 Tax=Leifsonia sp. NPDC058194 TaxID=3346374 RepID=UPI0036DBE503
MSDTPDDKDARNKGRSDRGAASSGDGRRPSSGQGGRGAGASGRGDQRANGAGRSYGKDAERGGGSNRGGYSRDGQSSGGQRSGGERGAYSRDGQRPSGQRPGGERGGYSRDGQRSGGERGGYSRDGQRPGGQRSGGERGGYSRDGQRSGGERGGYSRDGQRSGGERGGYSRDGQRYGGERGGYSRDGQRPGGQRSGGERGGYSRDGQRYGGERGGYSRDGQRPSGQRSGGERGGYSRDGQRYGGERGGYSRDGQRPTGRRSGDDRGRDGDRGGRDEKLWTRDGAPARGDRDARERELRSDEEIERSRELRSVRPHHDDPEIPEGVVARDLPGPARVELKTLSKDNAEWVAQHLVMVSRLIESDPDQAHRHALSAARRAGRIGVVRETLAITAYATGDFALALRELRTYRRISGSNDQLPLMVDSERGVGRPDRALELGRSVDKATLAADVQVSLAIAMSGARLDLGQPEAALAELEIPQLDPDRAFSWSPDLFHAYAEVLEELGRDEQAASWRERADRADEALADALDIDEHETIDVIEEEIFLDPGDFSAVSIEAEVDELLADDEEPANAEADAEADDDAESAAEVDDEVVADEEKGEPDDGAVPTEH